MGVSDQARDQVDKKVNGAAMAGMLNLRNVLKLVVDSLNDGALP